MTLKPLVWSGNQYTLQIRRHWSTFFNFTTVFTINAPQMEKLLPEGAGYHIISIHKLVDDARDYFETFDCWWSYSKGLCDQYCEFYVMEQALDGNTFNTYHNTYINDRYAVQNFAKLSKGYNGPEEWNLIQE